MRYQENYVTLKDQKKFNKMVNLLFDNYDKIHQCGANPVEVITLNKKVDGYKEGTKFVFIVGEQYPQRKIDSLFAELDYYSDKAKDSTVFKENPFLCDVQIISTAQMSSDKIFDKKLNIAAHQDFLEYWEKINNNADDAIELISLKISVLKRNIEAMEYTNAKGENTERINASKLMVGKLLSKLASQAYMRLEN